MQRMLHQDVVLERCLPHDMAIGDTWFHFNVVHFCLPGRREYLIESMPC